MGSNAAFLCQLILSGHGKRQRKLACIVSPMAQGGITMHAQVVDLFWDGLLINGCCWTLKPTYAFSYQMAQLPPKISCFMPGSSWFSRMHWIKPLSISHSLTAFSIPTQYNELCPFLIRKCVYQLQREVCPRITQRELESTVHANYRSTDDLFQEQRPKSSLSFLLLSYQSRKLQKIDTKQRRMPAHLCFSL